MNPKPFRVIPCQEWKARPPKGRITLTNAKPVRSIFHHTAGHHPELDGKHNTVTYEESCAYARSIQNFHMDKNGWNDTGQNFLVTRGGYILEGRHHSFDQIQRGKMVVSAHCPNENTQPGIEIEHIDPEPMTQIQYDAAVWLFAWIAKSCAFPGKSIDGHRDHYATACPGSLYAHLPQFRKDVAAALKPKPIPKPAPKISGHWQVTKTFYDGHTAPSEKVGSVRLWALKQGNLAKKGVRHIDWHWIETG